MSSRPKPQNQPGTSGKSGRNRRNKQRSGESNRSWIVLSSAIVIVLVIAALFVFKFSNSSSSTASNSPVSSTVLHDLTGVSTETENTVGTGGGPNLLVPVRDKVLTGSSGRPEIIYYGAEYCPYCAGERWAMIVALSRFGSFSGLQTTHSASDDVYPNTPTFTFYGSTYQSQYLDFTPIELQTNQRVNGQYATLQTPTPAQQQLFQRLDGPPYIPSNGAGGIPFITFANQYVLSGSTVAPNILQGETWDQIASRLNDPSTAESKAIVGGANQATAAICAATNNNPANVCGQPAIKAIEDSIAKTPVPTGQ